jgi:hypothetical protein
LSNIEKHQGNAEFGVKLDETFHGVIFVLLIVIIDFAQLNEGLFDGNLIETVVGNLI